MDNVETTQTDVPRNEDRGSSKLDLKEALAKQFEASEVEETEEDTAVESEPEESAPEKEDEEETEVAEAASEEPKEERIPLVPPADMNKAEKEAFLNPTPQNAHILQQYMNRRAYETRSDYQRRINEVEELKKQTSGVFETIKQYENDYAKQGISIGDIAKRSVAWDQAMKANPVQTALEWLDSYGVSLNDLMNQPQGVPDAYQQQMQQGQFLTREEAERIADDRFKAIQEEQQKNAIAYYNERAVESFVTAKPLFKDPETASQLEAEMAPIVSALTSTGRYSSPEEILETAYNYVVAGNPTFSSLVQKMTATPVIEKKQEVAQKARAASRSISGSAGSGTPRMQIKDIRDNLRRRMSGE